MAHVTLIRPPVLVTPFTSVGGAIPPLGLAYIAGTLRAGGHEVKCIDAPGDGLGRFKLCESDPSLMERGLSFDEILERIPDGTRVIGVSCMFSFEWFHVSGLIRRIRAAHPSALIALGGEHASADFEYILKSMPEVDAVILGEGENKMLGLVEAWEAGVAKGELPGVAVLDAGTGTVRKNAEKDGHYRILDVDRIPRPAWDLLPIEAYLDAGLGHGTFNYRAMPMLASRGCPHRCTFCSSPQMWTTRWKAREIDDVIDEIKTYIRKYKINRVLFYDLTVIIDKKWILEFCSKIVEQKLPITWAMPSGTRTEALGQDVLELLKKSGCDYLTYPLETGNPRVCDLIKKKINYKRSLSSMKNAVRAKINVQTNIIIGFPFQTYGDVFRELLFVFRLAWLGSHDVMFNLFSPYPGSELHNQLVAEGRIVKDENYPQLLRSLFLNNYSGYRSWNPRIPARHLRFFGLSGIALFQVLQFSFRPHRLVGLTYRLLAGKPASLLELGLACTMPRYFKRSWARLFGERSGSAA